MKNFKILVFGILTMTLFGLSLGSCAKDEQSSEQIKLNEEVIESRSYSDDSPAPLCLPGNCNTTGLQYGERYPNASYILETFCINMDEDSGCISPVDLQTAFEAKAEEVASTFGQGKGNPYSGCVVLSVFGEDVYCDCDGPSVCIELYIYFDCLRDNSLPGD